jgi:signal transduction histidine kinase
MQPRRSPIVRAHPDAAGWPDRFLSEASLALAESLDYSVTLAAVVRLAVPAMGDACQLDLVDDAGAIGCVASARRNAGGSEPIVELRPAAPGDGGDIAARVIAGGVTQYLPFAAISREHVLGATICTPLAVRDRTLGALTVSTEVGRQLTMDDVRCVEAFAPRAALAIDNARRYREAERALHAREQMLAAVAHDLRTPLSVVITTAALLTSVDAQAPESERIRQRGETISRAARHVSRLVHDLTDVAQMDAGHLAIVRAPDDPVALVREVHAALEPVVTNAGGTLEASVPPRLPDVYIDHDRVRQVLANLVSNASKVGASRIVMGLHRREHDLLFSVADDGPGIAAADLPHMFDLYWRGRTAHYEGSGLGLPIAHGIVTAHGGRMWVDSAPGAGTTFFFSIPLAAVPDMSGV